MYATLNRQQALVYMNCEFISLVELSRCENINSFAVKQMNPVPVNEIIVLSTHAVLIAVTRNVRNQRIIYAILGGK
jgi:hypothetical protein